MGTQFTDELIGISARLMLASSKSEILRIANDINSAVEKLIEKEKSGAIITPQEQSVSGILKFTKKEISNMDATFKKEFIANGLCAHIIKRESGKNSWCYEIRYRRNGYDISASSTNLIQAKQKFLEKTTSNNIDKYKKTYHYGNFIPVTFTEFTLFYFENFRKNKVAAQTYKCDMQRLNKYIIPYFKNMELCKITPIHCNNLIKPLLNQEKNKTAKELFLILSGIFKSAIAHGIMQNNPLNTIDRINYTQKNGVALSKSELSFFLSSLNADFSHVGFALGLFCGLRPNELSTAKIKGNFIIAVNSKRKNKKIEYKRIPILPELKPFIKNGIPDLSSPQVLRRKIKEILPNHKLYDLRTTFYSVCRECNVADAALHHFMGHSEGKITNAYTDLSDEYLLKEAEKIRFRE